MDFARPLLLLSGEALEDGLSLVEALCDRVGSLSAVISVREPTLALGEPDLLSLERALEGGEAILAALRARLPGVPFEGEVQVGRPIELLPRAMMRFAPDLVVLGPHEEAAGCALEVARTYRIAACSAGTTPPPRPIRRLLHAFAGGADALTAIGALFRDRCDEAHTLWLVALGPLDPRLSGEAGVLAAVAGVRAQVLLEEGLGALARLSEADAVVLSADAANLAEGLAVQLGLRALAHGPRPLLFVPSQLSRPARDGVLDACDAVASGDGLSIRVERVPAFGGPVPLEDQPVELLARGVRLGAVSAAGGLLIVPRVLEREGALGLGRQGERALEGLEGLEVAVATAPFAAEQHVMVDARLSVEALARVRAVVGDRPVLAVRIVPDVPAREVRSRVRAAGFSHVRVFDVRDLLDEGEPHDVPALVAAVRLARAAARLRADGVAVGPVVALEPARALGVVSAAAVSDQPYEPPTPARTLDERLDALTASRVLSGHEVHVELDNAEARRALIGRIAAARIRVHAQWYIVEDDEIAREIEAALADAALRGVSVRVLCDSLYSLHGSLGAENPLLTRLSRLPNVEVRASRPVDHLPSVEDLKQRDHRKLLVVDGVRAMVSGRNLGRAYYRSFAEAQVSETSTHADLPWLDASVELGGPAARLLDESFLEAFGEAGGSRFELFDAPPLGSTDVRVVVHRGLRDAHTLEAYRSLIEAARTRLLVVNNFPLQLELQHALLDALRRGVRVSMLVGRARPSHGSTHGDDVPFAGAAYHGIADVLVRARLSSLLSAGAEVRELVASPPPGWDAALGQVRPHVHAKLMCADDRVLALGSANLDVTAGYWESELLVVLSDPRVVAPVVAALDALMAGSSALDPEGAKWLEGARVRDLLARVWPTVLG